MFHFIVLGRMGSKNSFMKLLFFIPHIILNFSFCLTINRILSLNNWKNISPVIQFGRNNRYADENELEYRSSFPLVISYELRKLFPYVSMCQKYMTERWCFKLSYIVGPKTVHLLSKFTPNKISITKSGNFNVINF